MRLKHTALAAIVVFAAPGQTLVDLRTQAKSIDFTAANTTKPFKSGTILPATCSVGEAFFKSDAPAGSNLYACTALNAWTLEAGVAGLNIAVGGATQGLQPTLNFIAGNGMLETCTNNAGANRVDCTSSLNTAVALTIAAHQSGAPLYCNSTNGTTAYTCSLASAKALAAYTPGMFVILTADTTNTGAASLNIDSLGVKNIRQSDGSTAPAAGMITTGRPVTIFYDGSVWRLPQYDGVPVTLAANNFANGISAAGVLTGAQPAFTDLSGSPSVAQVKGNFSGTCDNTTFLRGDGACAAVTGTGDTITSPSGSINIGGTSVNTTLDVSTLYLNNLYPQLNPVSGVNLYPAGITSIFVSSSTNPALRIAGGTLPSGGANLLSGSIANSNANILSQWNGFGWMSYPSVTGTLPVNGNVAVWGSNYDIEDGQITLANLARSNAVNTFTLPQRLAPVAFSTLPACAAGTEGEHAAINDSTVDTWGTTIAGGGSNHVLAYCDGSNWTVAGR